MKAIQKRQELRAYLADNNPARVHAGAILDLPEAAQEAAIEALPAGIRENVRIHVKDHWEKVAGLVKWVYNQPDREARREALSHVPVAVRETVQHRVLALWRQKGKG